MTEPAAPSLIERKIAANRSRAERQAMTPVRALELAFARSVEKLMKMPVRLLSAATARQSGAEIVETLPEQALLTLTEGPGGGLGVAMFTPEALACLIEMLTLGRLDERAPPARRPTRTDAAMCAGLLDAVLGEMESLLAGEPDVTWAGGFRYSSHLPDPRPLGLMLDEPAYRSFRLMLGFGAATAGGEGGRRGEVILVFPARGRGAMPLRPADPVELVPTDPMPAVPAGSPGWAEGLARAIAPAPVQIEAVLARMTLPLSALLRLERGMLLPVPMALLQSVRVEGGDGRLICLAQLGQGGGRRALRLLIDAAAGEPPLAPPVGIGEVLEANPPLTTPATDGARSANAADAAAAEAAADRLMQDAMAEVARAG